MLFKMVEKETGQHCAAVVVIGDVLMVWKYDDGEWATLRWNAIPGHYEYLEEE